MGKSFDRENREGIVVLKKEHVNEKWVANQIDRYPSIE